MKNDAALFRSHRGEGSPEAFAEFVRRHFGLFFGATPKTEREARLRQLSQPSMKKHTPLLSALALAGLCTVATTARAQYAFVLGQNASAEDYGFAFGFYASADAHSFAFGDGATAEGNSYFGSFAAGQGASSGPGGIAIGYGAYAPAGAYYNAGVAIGEYAFAGMAAVAIGDQAYAEDTSVALGKGAYANSFAVSMGVYASASDLNSVSLGSYSSASASKSTALGYYAKAASQGGVALGVGNLTTSKNGSAPNPLVPAAGDPILMVGNAPANWNGSDATRANALTVYRDGSTRFTGRLELSTAQPYISFYNPANPSVSVGQVTLPLSGTLLVSSGNQIITGNTSLLGTTMLGGASSTVQSVTVDGSSGNVGIGTPPTATSKLTLAAGNTPVGGQAAANGVIQIVSSGGNTEQTPGGIEFKSAASGAGYGFRFHTPDLGTGQTPFYLQRRSNSAAWTTALTVLGTNGNVGVGSTTPQTKLHVAGGLMLGVNNTTSAHANPSTAYISSRVSRESAYHSSQTAWYKFATLPPSNNGNGSFLNIEFVGGSYLASHKHSFKAMIATRGGVIAKITDAAGQPTTGLTTSGVVMFEEPAGAGYSLYVKLAGGAHCAGQVTVADGSWGYGATFLDIVNGTPTTTSTPPGTLVFDSTVASAYTNLFTDYNTSRVGVGTTAPAAKLDVNGTVQISGDVKIKNKAVIRVSKAGDLGMGLFTAGVNPETN